QLPATSVNWGPWRGGGMATPEAQQVLEMMGIETLEPESAVWAGLLVDSERPQRVVASIQWRTFKDIYQARRKRPFLHRIEVASDSTLPFSGNRSEFATNIRELPVSEQRAKIVEHLKVLLGQILGLDESEPIADDQDLLSLGLDSIM